MRKSFKNILILCVCMVIAVISAVSIIAATIIRSGDYVLSVEDDNSTALSGWESQGVLNVPNSVDSYYISSIADYAFMDNTDITGLNLSSAYTLRKIGYMSFKGCSEIADNITIPSRVTSLGMGAFQECSSISSVDLYSGSKSVPAQMFYDCDALETVVINYGFTSIGKLAFANCSSLSSVTISLTVNEIHNTAFNNCPDLVIYCYTDSYAHQYAEDKGIEYVLIDAQDPTDPTEPETAATEPASEESTSAPLSNILGDTDNSGYIDIVDATFVQRYATNIEVPLSHYVLLQGDVDRSGDLEITDAAFIMRHIIRMKTPYAIGEAIPA